MGTHVSDAVDGTTERSERDRRSRRIRALLAGGLVLGIGAAVTLAAWTDNEFAQGSFTASRFDLQGSTDGTAYADHATAPGAPLTFTLDPSSLAPGDVVTAPFAVRLAANTSENANVTVSVASSTGTLTGLTYKLDRMPAWGCGGTPSAAVIASSPLTGGAGAFTLAQGSPTTSPGTPAYLCFTVTAGAGLTQGQTGSVVWQFAAQSS
jgi:predicted ribosomally synthesized peptide with SipW-like signal peptide